MLKLSAAKPCATLSLSDPFKWNSRGNLSKWRNSCSCQSRKEGKKLFTCRFKNTSRPSSRKIIKNHSRRTKNNLNKSLKSSIFVVFMIKVSSAYIKRIKAQKLQKLLLWLIVVIGAQNLWVSLLINKQIISTKTLLKENCTTKLPSNKEANISTPTGGMKWIHLHWSCRKTELSLKSLRIPRTLLHSREF